MGDFTGTYRSGVASSWPTRLTAWAVNLCKANEWDIAIKISQILYILLSLTWVPWHYSFFDLAHKKGVVTKRLLLPFHSLISAVSWHHIVRRLQVLEYQLLQLWIRYRLILAALMNDQHKVKEILSFKGDIFDLAGRKQTLNTWRNYEIRNPTPLKGSYAIVRVYSSPSAESTRKDKKNIKLCLYLCFKILA